MIFYQNYHISGVFALSCYECENCVSEHPGYLNEKVKECPDSSYVSCLKTESKFAHYTSKYILTEENYHTITKPLIFLSICRVSQLLR